ncbi:MAG: tetratricopeptide repeat protein [Phaeodactylibacter sp.]|nr:tetratricopeptide repeat protein [Phaeodactylibacter sp.]
MRYLLAAYFLFFPGFPQAEAQAPDSIRQLLDAAWRAYDGQDYPAMRSLAARSLELAARYEQEGGMADSYQAMGRAEEGMRNWAAALRNYQRALAIQEQRGARREAASLYQDIAILKDAEGNYETARRFAERAVALFEVLKDSFALANALVDLANPNKSLGDFRQALGYFQRADTLFRALGDSVGMAISGYGAGDLFYQLKEYKKARPYVEAAIPAFEREEEYAKMAMAYNVLAGIDEAEGQRAKAREKYGNSISWAEKAGDSLSIFDASLNLAEMAAADGNPEQARRLLAAARKALGKKASMLDQASLDKVAASVNALEHQIENKRLYMWLSVFLVFLSGFGALAFWQYRKRKANALALQLQMIEHQRRVNALLDDIQLSNESARLEGEKRERKKITKTLHDTVGSQLAATRWLQEANIEALRNGTLGQEDMQNVLKMMGEAYKNARNVERLLDKDSIDWLDEVGGFFHALSERSQLEVKYVVRGLEEKPDWEMGLAIYKIVLTLAANVLLHAEARRLSALITRAEGGLSIHIEDNGVGFDKNSVQYGNGLKNVEEYVRQYKGRIRVEPRPGEGTAIDIFLPENK